MKADLEKNVPMVYLSLGLFILTLGFFPISLRGFHVFFFNAICFVPSNFQDPHALQLEEHPD